MQFSQLSTIDSMKPKFYCLNWSNKNSILSIECGFMQPENNLRNFSVRIQCIVHFEYEKGLVFEVDDKLFECGHCSEKDARLHMKEIWTGKLEFITPCSKYLVFDELPIRRFLKLKRYLRLSWKLLHSSCKFVVQDCNLLWLNRFYLQERVLA